MGIFRETPVLSTAQKNKITSIRLFTSAILLVALISVALSFFNASSEQADTSPPKLGEHYLSPDKQYITIVVSDDKSEIDFLRAYAIDSSGNRIRPTRYSNLENTLTFPFPTSSLNIYISDVEGNTMRVLLTP